jgi:small subunit ribosomal protein S9
MATATDKKYIEAIGRRKTATARVRLTPATKASFVVNDKPMTDYFPTKELQLIAEEAFKTAGIPAKFMITVKASGSGPHSQAEAVRQALARILVIHDADLKGPIKKAKLLTRDARAKERRKFGLTKARKAPQWSKR